MSKIMSLNLDVLVVKSTAAGRCFGQQAPGLTPMLSMAMSPLYSAPRTPLNPICNYYIIIYIIYYMYHYIVCYYIILLLYYTQGRRYYRHEYTIVSPWPPEMCIFVSKYRKIMGKKAWFYTFKCISTNTRI